MIPPRIWEVPNKEPMYPSRDIGPPRMRNNPDQVAKRNEVTPPRTIQASTAMRRTSASATLTTQRTAERLSIRTTARCLSNRSKHRRSTLILACRKLQRVIRFRLNGVAQHDTPANGHSRVDRSLRTGRYVGEVAVEGRGQRAEGRGEGRVARFGGRRHDAVRVQRHSRGLCRLGAGWIDFAPRFTGEQRCTGGREETVRHDQEGSWLGDRRRRKADRRRGRVFDTGRQNRRTHGQTDRPGSVGIGPQRPVRALPTRFRDKKSPRRA